MSHYSHVFSGLTDSMLPILAYRYSVVREILSVAQMSSTLLDLS